MTEKIPQIIDTHLHLDLFDNSDRILEEAELLGIGVVAMTNAPFLFEACRKICKKYSYAWASLGMHPELVPQYKNQLGQFCDLSDLTSFIGEIGLDYHYMNSPKEVQKVVFENQLRIAQRNNLPVIIHTREAEEDTYQILKKREIRRGLIHCFSGEKRALTKYLNLGFYISLAGNVTFPQASKLREMASLIPLNRLLVETDSPYLAPQKVRGQRNEPAFLKYTLEEIARLRKISLKRLSEITEQNAKEFFRITEKII